MQTLKMLTRKKQSAKTPNLQTETTPSKGTGEDSLYLQSIALSCKTPATYASPSTVYPLNYGLLQVVKTPGLVIREPVTGIDPVDPLVVPDLDELAEKGKSL